MIKAWTRRFLIGLGVIVLLIQLIPYGRDHTNSSVRAEPAWDNRRTRELAVRACFVLQPCADLVVNPMGLSKRGAGSQISPSGIDHRKKPGFGGSDDDHKPKSLLIVPGAVVNYLTRWTLIFSKECTGGQNFCRYLGNRLSHAPARAKKRLAWPMTTLPAGSLDTGPLSDLLGQDKKLEIVSRVCGSSYFGTRTRQSAA